MVRIWQVISQNVIEIIIPVITLIIGVFLGSLRERNKEQERRLKVHFEELKTEAEINIISVMSGVSEHYGRIVIYSRPNTYTIQITIPHPSSSFMMHFPEETAALADYEKNIIKHNKVYEALCVEITDNFKSKGLEVVSINTKISVPHIWDNIFWLLFEWWLDRYQGKIPVFNFKQIETREGFSPHNLLVAGCNSQSVAYAETDGDKESCISAIWAVADNKEYEREAVEIVNSARKLVEEVVTFNNELKDKLSNIYKFELWHGRHKKFKIQGMCPTCQKYVQ